MERLDGGPSRRRRGDLRSDLPRERGEEVGEDLVVLGDPLLILRVHNGRLAFNFLLALGCKKLLRRLTCRINEVLRLSTP